MVNVIEAMLRSFDKPLILWLLCRNPIHGYGIIKELKKITGRKMKPSLAYSFLHWLENGGYAKSIWLKSSGRSVRYYSLTGKGEDLLRDIRGFLKKSLKEMMADFLVEKAN